MFTLYFVIFCLFHTFIYSFFLSFFLYSIHSYLILFLPFFFIVLFTLFTFIISYFVYDLFIHISFFLPLIVIFPLPSFHPLNTNLHSYTSIKSKNSSLLNRVSLTRFCLSWLDHYSSKPVYISGCIKTLFNKLQVIWS